MKRFDCKSFKKGDKVLVRTGFGVLSEWKKDVFDMLCKSEDMNVCVCEQHKVTVVLCIPYNEETQHLLGTKDDAPLYYQYWQDDPCHWF